jgi:acetyl-CoA acyltransferase
MVGPFHNANNYCQVYRGIIEAPTHNAKGAQLMQDAVIVDALRTPIGKRNGSLKEVHPVDLCSRVLTELVSRAGIDPAIVEDVILGCVAQIGEQASNVGRNAWLASGFPYTTAASTITRACGSSQGAVHFAAALIQSGACDVIIAGGVESMTRIPLGSAAAAGPGTPYPPSMLEFYDLVHQGISAQLMANKYGVGRREMDEYSVRSHQLAAAATAEGRLRSQIVPIEVDGAAPVSRDEGIRPDTSYEVISQLKPAFDPEHDITAGNASQISDGAAAVLLLSADKAKELGLRPRARIVSHVVVGVDPVIMLEGPIPATAAVLRKSGLPLGAIDLFEVNEAFASVVLAWQSVTGADMDKVNVNGGAISIGHPLGASGARLMCHLLYELERRDLQYGLEAMCCGGGLGTATIIERLNGHTPA